MRTDLRDTLALSGSALRRLAAAGTTRPTLAMVRLSRPYYQVLWLGTAARGGVLSRLSKAPATASELASALGMPVAAEAGLTAWLDLGAAVGLVRERGGRYRLRGLARPLARARNDAIAALYTELSTLHHALVTDSIDRLRESRPFELADADADLIARSSRIGEPFVAAAIDAVVPRDGAVRLVEVGCGSGAHIRTAALINPQLTAVGLELQDAAAEQARRNLAEWGLADRVAVEVADVRARSGAGDADVVTLHQNIYYFPVADRLDVLRHVGSWLTPGGRLLVTTICRSGSPAAAGLDLWCAMTRDVGRLPRVEEVPELLRAAGYADVRTLRLTPDGMYAGFVGTWEGRGPAYSPAPPDGEPS